MVALGKVINELFVLGGAAAAETFARERGRNELAEKIRWGQFRPNRSDFDSERARARAEALAWLRKQPGKKVAVA